MSLPQTSVQHRFLRRNGQVDTPTTATYAPDKKVPLAQFNGQFRELPAAVLKQKERLRE